MINPPEQPQPAVKRPDTTMRIVLIAGVSVGAVIMLCFTLLCAFVILNPNPRTALPPGRSVYTPTPPRTPPTETPAGQPANAGPTQTIDPDVFAYQLQVLIAIDDFQSGVDTLGPLMTQAGSDTTLLRDDTWRAQVAAAAEKIRKVYRDLSALTPPAYLEETHATLLAGTADCSDAMDELETGIDLLDMSYFEKADKLIESCNEKINRAGELVTSASATQQAAQP